MNDLLKIFFFNETSYHIKKEFQNKVSEVIEKKSKELKYSTLNINIIIVNEKYLLDINKKYLKHNYKTDVITFDYSRKNVKELKGEIFISYQMIVYHSKEYNVTFYNELARVIFHGFLHLIGFDDKNLEQKKIMKKKEDELLSSLNINV